MSVPSSVLFKPPPWSGSTASTCVLYHGCTEQDADNIENYGIDLSRCRPDADFGKGFYLTTHKRQAQQWAWYRHYSLPAHQRATNPAVILAFSLSRNDLADLEHLAFVRGDFGNESLWSLIHRFRDKPTGRDHARGLGAGTWFDVVWGPVSVLWQQRNAMADADQVSFHTEQAVALLQREIDSRSVTRQVVS